MKYHERARKYAEKVVAGEIPACALVKSACERHLLDLERQEDKKFPYRFDPEQADRPCSFIEKLPHVKGKWAANKELMRLEDWQCFIVCSVFGWVKKTTGKRRFIRVYIEVARKNGKSQLTAGIGLYMLGADGEFGAEVYSGAGSEKQAWEVFRPAKLMAKNTPELCEALGIEVNAKNLHILATASKFEPVIGKPGDGASPSMAITDEFHEHLTDDQYDTMLTGMAAREQPISWVITTAGVDTAGPCYALRNEVVDVLNGSVTNEELFGIVYTIDPPRKVVRDGVEIEIPGDDWATEKALQKANPNLGVSVFPDFLLPRLQEAINNPRKQSTYKTKHLNVWVGAASPYFNIEKWRKLNDAPPIEEFKGEACWGGLDLASKLDLCADVKVFKRPIDGKDHFYAYLRAYIPEDRIEDPDKRHYSGWVKEKFLVATPGNITDYDEIEERIKADTEEFRYLQLGVDPYNATQLTTHLSNLGLEVVEIPQTVLHLSEPMKQIQALIEDGRLHHDGNPVFTWGIGNVTAKVDRNDNVFPRKERQDNKIDPASALINAFNRIMGGDEPQESVYAKNEMFVL